jgi:hypothetical protein
VTFPPKTFGEKPENFVTNVHLNRVGLFFADRPRSLGIEEEYSLKFFQNFREWENASLPSPVKAHAKYL